VNDPGYEFVPDLSTTWEEHRQCNPALNRFETPVYGFDEAGIPVTRDSIEPDVLGFCYDERLLDYLALNSWLIENNRLVKSGLYELSHSSDIAVEIMAGNTSGKWLPGLKDGGTVDVFWVYGGGVLVQIGDDSWELVMFKPYNNRPFFEENGSSYCTVERPQNLQLMFKLKDSQHSRSSCQPGTSRQSDLDYLIGLYLDETENVGGLAGLKRFMIEKHKAKILPGDKLEWPIYGQKPKKLAIATIKNKLSKIKGRRKA
jgi:hypothetical protein